MKQGVTLEAKNKFSNVFLKTGIPIQLQYIVSFGSKIFYCINKSRQESTKENGNAKSLF